ncbi:MAG: transporter ATP-binding protein [Ilumatobacteraceae bacterium]|nr:transporter ATP-binding protein [Ilumatobacteraceae bacterium]
MTLDAVSADLAAGAGAPAPAVRLRGISKSYRGVRANDAIDLDLRAGSVHGLLGENGAGKSTLVKILFGLIQPDAGTIEVAGTLRRWRSPRDALAAGIGMVQQHFSLIADFSVAENLVLGAEPRRHGLLDRRRAEREVQALADRYGFRLDASRRVGELAVGARQRVEILKALHRGASTLILDEPTAALAPQEVDELFGVVAELRAQGCTIVLITHKLAEIVAMCDDVTVLRDGAVVGERTIAAHEREPGSAARDALEAELAIAMVGRSLPDPPSRQHSAGVTVLELRGVADGHGLGPLDLVVRSGEIVGVAGVEGNGQTELIEAIVGVRRVRAGRIELDGTDVSRWSVRRRLAAGLAHIAEDRHAGAVALDMPLVDNCVLGSHDRPPFTRQRVRLVRREMTRFTREVIAHHQVRVPSLDATVGQLSGGNQQKLVVGREVSRAPRLLVAAQPTRGLDVGATAFVHGELAALRAAGCAVLLVSLDLTEVMALSDRIVVMRDGAIAGEARAEDTDVIQLGSWMTGAGG